MARKKSPSSRLTRIPHALELFTDRESQRQHAAEFFTALATDPPRLTKPVLNFYGVGGIGKTTLLAKIKEELVSKNSSVRLVHLDVDDQRWSIANTDVGSFFWLIRKELHRCGIPTPLFDCLYAIYYSHQHPVGAGQFHNNPILELCEDAAKIGEVTATVNADLSALGEVFEALKDAAEHAGKTFKIPALIGNIWGKIRDRSRQKQILQLHIDLHQISLKEMEGRLPDLLHHDIAECLLENSSVRIAIAIDGFERIQTSVAAEDIQNALQKFCGYLLLHDSPEVKSHCGFLLLGREKLRWDEIYDAEWAKDIDCYKLSGLMDDDAKIFVGKASAFYDKVGDPKTGQNIRRHREAILVATRDEDGTHHPYFLDLAVEIIRDRREAFHANDLGQTPKEMQIRFFRYLNVPEREKEFRALKILALALGFDESIYQHLAVAGYILYGKHELELLVRDRSCIVPDRNRPGYWRFHRFMEQALIDCMVQDAAEKKVAEKVVTAILDYHRDKTHFEKMADCAMTHLDHYRMGMEVAFCHWKNKLLTFSVLRDYFRAYNEEFDSHFATQFRLPNYQQFREICEQVLGAEHPDTLTSLNNLANLLLAKGDYTAAECLHRSVLGKRNRVLGKEHPETLTSLNILGKVLALKGDYSAARKTHRYALKMREQVLGLDHPDTLESLSDLANVLQSKRTFTQRKRAALVAEPLHRRALETRKRVLGKDHPDTLASMVDLAIVLKRKRDYVKALTLFRRALIIRERVLGKDHPDTLNSVNELANILSERNRFPEAEILWRRALEARERVLGSDHPDTLTSVKHLANILLNRGDRASAEHLYLRVLNTRKRVLGEHHSAHAIKYQKPSASLKVSSSKPKERSFTPRDASGNWTGIGCRPSHAGEHERSRISIKS